MTMSRDKKTPKTLADEDIVTAKKISRRSLLAVTGIGAALAAALTVARTRKAFAGDQKEGDMQDRTPPKIDGSRDTD